MSYTRRAARLERFYKLKGKQSVTTFKYLTAGVLLASVCATAYADTGLTVGAGVGVGKSPYKQYDNDVIPVPAINYDSEHFWWHGLGGGYYLWNDDADKLSVTGYWDPMRFKPSDSDNHRLRQLDKRRSTVMAGLTYEHFTPYGFLHTTFAGDVLDNSNGFVWDLAWLYRYTTGGLSVTPGIGVEWNSENQNQYYYGVSHKESRRSGLSHYNPDDSWNPYLQLAVNYNLTDSWSVYALGRYTRLTDETKDSPMVNKSWTGILSTGITYSF